MKKVWKVLFCILCMANLLPLHMIAAIELDYEIIDDIDERVTYTAGTANQGGWEASGEGSPEVTEHWSNSAGAVSEIRFEGSKFELYGKKDPSHAIFSVVIDDGEAIECDAYAERVDKEAKLYESGELKDGEHVAKITVLEKRNIHSTGTGNIYGVQFVYAKVYSSPINIPQPILYYNFNDHTAADNIGNYHGALIDEPQFTAGLSGLGEALDTSQGGYVELSEDFSLNDQNFTIAFFVKSLEDKNDTVLFANKAADSGRDQGFSICNYDGVFGNAGDDTTRYDTSSYDRDRTVLDGAWHHVAVTADREDKLALYVDGVLSNENTDFKKLAGHSLDTIGRYVLGAGSTGKYPQKALYDELKIYNTALTSKDVENLYNSYDQDTQLELENAMSMISDGEINVSLKANQEMKDHAVKKYVEKLITTYKGIDIDVEFMQGDQYNIQLSKARKTVNKTVVFTFHENETLRVASYNIYGWGYPNMKNISDKLDMMNVDIAGLQEANYQPNGKGQVSQLTAQGSYPYSAFKEGYGTDTIWGGSTLVSKYPLSEIGGVNYEVNDNTNRSYVRSVIYVGDKKVALYNTHIVWLEDSEQYAKYKQAQIQQLIQAVEKDDTPYKIITGDFNTDQSIEELDQLMLHFNSANGWQNTWYETCDKDASMKIGTVDQIFTTTNIEFMNIGVMDGGQSDHDIIYADLILNEDGEEVPRQLLDNTLSEVEVFLSNESRYETAGIEKLRSIKKTILEEAVTKDNIFRSVQKLREAIKDLVEKVEPIGEPILYYNFDQQDAKDIAGDYHGVLRQNPSFEKGLFGNALTIGEGFVEIPKDFKLGNHDFTISFWLKTNEQKQDTVLFSNKSGDSGNEKGFFICNYNGLYANVGTGEKRYDTSASNRDETAVDGEWHLITVTADRSDRLSLYVDGIKSASNTDFKDVESLLLDTDDAYVIGAGSRGGYKHKANIDEFKVYNYALDEKQVNYIYKSYLKQDTGYRDILHSVIIKAETFVDSDQFMLLAPTVKAYLKECLHDALAVYEDKTANEMQYLDAWKKLAEALHYGDFKADKTLLKTLIEECEQIDTSIYEEGVEAFLEALVNAKKVLDSDAVLQQSIDQAYHELEASKAGLKDVPKEDQRFILSYVIEQADRVLANQSYYLHDEKWDLFITTLSDAKSVFANNEADQNAIMKAIFDLTNAYEHIRLLPDEGMLDKLETFINTVMNISRNQFNLDELAQIDETFMRAEMMFKTKDFTSSEFTAFSDKMADIMEIINKKQVQDEGLRFGNEKADLPDSTTHREGYIRPQTSDSTNIKNLIGLLAVGGFVMIICRKKK